MPDVKKNDKKNAKEQRKPRQRNQQGPKAEEKPDKVDDTSNVPKVSVPQKPPVYESPPPEFFKNLKRETDEILKITEEENSKYKKKEIQSNWSKYEVPIESYEQIDEQENMGADFEKLIQEPLVAGAHFQFKHEKSWDINIGPTQYDKYFEIDMEDLNVALCSIPFYDRSNVEQSIFKEADILTMNNRATKFKQKYYNDNTYTTPETEAHDKILNSLRDVTKHDNSTKLEKKCDTDLMFNTKSDNTIAKYKDLNTDSDKIIESTKDLTNLAIDRNLELTNKPFTVDANKELDEKIVITENHSLNIEPSIMSKETAVEEEIAHDDFIFRTTEKMPNVAFEKQYIDKVSDLKKTPTEDPPSKEPIVEMNVPIPVASKTVHGAHTVTKTPVDTKKAVIESPEDLEKWLDDFLDG